VALRAFGVGQVLARLVRVTAETTRRLGCCHIHSASAARLCVAGSAIERGLLAHRRPVMGGVFETQIRGLACRRRPGHALFLLSIVATRAQLWLRIESRARTIHHMASRAQRKQTRMIRVRESILALRE
jgi:hypothetical protein